MATEESEEQKDDLVAYCDRELIETVNRHLREKYGKYNDKPHFRVVWSDDQFEKRWVQHTDEGWELLNPVVKERPKYRQYAAHRYMLERYVPVPKGSDLVEPVSYEPIWAFQTSVRSGRKFLPVRIDACEFIIDSILAVVGKSGHKRYTDPNVTEEGRQKQILEMEKTLFDNETAVGDALAYGSGVVVAGTGDQKSGS